MTIAVNIRKLRNSLNMTQSELAEKANLSLRGIQAIETQERVPRMETLQQIADALGVSISELYSTGKNETLKASDRASLILEIQSRLSRLGMDDLEHVSDSLDQIERLKSNKAAKEK